MDFSGSLVPALVAVLPPGPVGGGRWATLPSERMIKQQFAADLRSRRGQNGPVSAAMAVMGRETVETGRACRGAE